MNDHEKSENDKLYDNTERIANSLSEHFDAVLILASKIQPDGSTTIMYVGKGNYYTRTGMAREYLENDKAKTISGQINRQKD